MKIQERIFKKQIEKYTKTFQSLPTQKEKSDNLPTTQSERNKIITKEEFLQTLKEDICCENYNMPLNAPYFLSKLEMIKLIETKGV